MGIPDVRDLDVFNLAVDGAARIYRVTELWPRRELFGMTSQIRKSGTSVCSNLGEAWRKRRLYAAAFVSKLSDAETEAGETQVWLLLAKRFTYIDESTFVELDHLYDRIIGKLVTMSAQPEKWCPVAALRR